MPFAIGCILAFGQLGPEQINMETLGDKTLQQMMTKVTMVEADDLNGPDYQPHYPECARVIISMANGETCTGVLGAQPGMPENPLPDSALSQKFQKLHGLCRLAGRTETLLERLWNIDTCGRRPFAPARGSVMRYSLGSLVRNAVTGQKHWPKVWREPEPKRGL